jgi:flagellar protein FliS
MTNEHLTEYRRTQLFGMSQAELVVMLYQGAIRFLREAVDLIASERYDQSWRKLDRARRIVVHLCGTLNRDAGELADKLASLYAFIIEQITVANAHRDIEVAENCIQILTTLKEGWVGVAAKEASEKTGSIVEHPVPAVEAPSEPRAISFQA